MPLRSGFSLPLPIQGLSGRICRGLRFRCDLHQQLKPLPIRPEGPCISIGSENPILMPWAFWHSAKHHSRSTQPCTKLSKKTRHGGREPYSAPQGKKALLEQKCLHTYTSERESLCIEPARVALCKLHVCVIHESDVRLAQNKCMPANIAETKPATIAESRCMPAKTLRVGACQRLSLRVGAC